MDAHFQTNLARVRAIGEKLSIAVVPCVCQLGRANAMLARDPNLAEGVPVRNALFVVTHGAAQLVADPAVSLPVAPDGLDWGTSLSGGVVRIKNCFWRARFHFRARVSPFRHYHLSVQVRSSGFSGSPSYAVLDPKGHPLAFPRPLAVREKQDWTRYELTFNSLDNRQVTIWMGLWHSSRGVLEWTNWQLEEAGLVNVLRRPGTPCLVANADNGRPYAEGADYQPIVDPALEAVRGSGNYSDWHAPPPIFTRLPEGTRLRVSWYHPMFVNGDKTGACPSDSGTYRLLASEIDGMRRTFGGEAFLLDHDEIRVMNWDAACAASGRSAGEVLAANVRRCFGLIGPARVYAWGDMFDPLQNAVGSYYLVNGDLAGSWNGLDRSITILNWNSFHPRESLRFFSKLGHPQIIAGYYDGKVAGVRDWLSAARGVPGVVGVMYTTWKSRYNDLEAFAREVKSAGAP